LHRKCRATQDKEPDVTQAIDEQDDDAPVGRILSRREVLGLLGGLGAVLLVGCSDNTAATTTPAQGSAPAATPTPAAATAGATSTALPAEGATAQVATPAASPTAETAASVDCVARPELTEGPYFKDEKINRSDIRSDTSTGAVKEGLPLALTFLVSSVAANACKPLQGAQVDVWHCDAAGTYSDTSDPNWGSTVGQNYLRGYQLTDAQGKAAFTTIYPGWYRGRAVHIHFKIRTTGTDGNAYEFTSQLFFDDTLSDQVFAQAPYAAKGTRDTRNSNDNIYQSGGAQLLLNPTGDLQKGYAATMSIALDLSDTKVGASDSNAQNGGGPGGPPPGGGPGGPGSTRTP
jgi:protocatechuate 3,4-dioxygenase beta subunit